MKSPLTKQGLYRVVYQFKGSNSISGPDALHTYADAKRLVEYFNARYGDECQYFTMPVDLASLPKQMLLALVQEQKLRVEEVAPYLKQFN